MNDNHEVNLGNGKVEVTDIEIHYDGGSWYDELYDWYDGVSVESFSVRHCGSTEEWREATEAEIVHLETHYPFLVQAYAKDQKGVGMEQDEYDPNP